MKERVMAQVDISALRHNMQELRQIVGMRTNIMAIVKADAYGHGACEISKAAVSAGAEWLGVATLEEAIQLGKATPGASICILSPIQRDEAEEVVFHRFIPIIGDFETALALSKAAHKLRSNVKVHIEVDTGMGRSGCLPEQASKLADMINRLNGITITGLMTHFPVPEDDATITLHQFQTFLSIVKTVEATDTFLQHLHCASSAAILRYPETRLNMIRPGLLIYGIRPSVPGDVDSPNLKPMLTLKSQIVAIRSLSAGSSISYGRTHVLRTNSRLATIPVGYGDGYPRALGNKADVLISGKRCPILGRVCMDVMVVDVSHVIDASIGSEVVLIGAQANEKILAEDLARMVPTTEHDITTRLTSRVPRAYINS